MVLLPTHPPTGLSNVGHQTVLILSTFLFPCGHEERLFNKMQLSLLFIGSTLVKGMSLFPLGWRTRVSLYKGLEQHQGQPKGNPMQVR